MKKRFTETKIIGFLREAEAGLPIKQLCRKHGFSEASYYLWRSKFGGMSVSDAKRLKELTTENARLKKLLAESLLENEVDAGGPTKKVVTAPDRRTLVRGMTERGLSERRALGVARMSASSLRYTPAPGRNQALRTRIITLAHRHRRYGAGMIYLKLRQAGERVNHKRVERLYTEAHLQVRRRRRKKIPVADRQPLVRPQTPNEVWSADFVFDRTAEGRMVKCLTIVDDATTEAVAIVPARALGGLPVTRVLDRLARPRPPSGPAHRQRTGILRTCHADVGARPWRHAAPDRTWQADAERLHRIVQRSVSRRVSQRALVHEPGPRPDPHRGRGTASTTRSDRRKGWVDSRLLAMPGDSSQNGVQSPSDSKPHRY